MRLDGYGLFVKDMPAMIHFYRDVLGFEIKEDENTSNVYLLKDGTLFCFIEEKILKSAQAKNTSIHKRPQTLCAGRWQIINLSLFHIRAATTTVIIQQPICLFSSGILPE